MLEWIDARFISCRCFSFKCIWHPSIAANLMSNTKWMFWCCTNESVVSPSSVRTDTLTDMVAHMREKVGLVHQMPFVCDRPGLPSTLEQVRYCITLKSLTWIGSTTKNLKGFNINSDRGKRVWIGSISIQQKVCHLLTLQNSHSVQICWHMRGAIPWSDYYEIWPTVRGRNQGSRLPGPSLMLFCRPKKSSQNTFSQTKLFFRCCDAILHFDSLRGCAVRSFPLGRRRSAKFMHT